MEIELKISNGEYLTHKDLEKYLNEYEEYYNKSIQEDMTEYEWKDFIIENNSKIEKSISEIAKIELLVRDIKRVENYFPGWEHLKSQPERNPKRELYQHEVIESEDLSVLLRGNEKIGTWIKWSGEYYDKILLKEVFIIEFEEIIIEKTKKPRITKSIGQIQEYTIPIISFVKIVTKKPEGLKKGERVVFNLNIVNRKKYLGKEEYINLMYVETVNLISPLKKITKKKESNSTFYDKLSRWLRK